MHGFDHIIFFNDHSVDNSVVELKPWIEKGFVSIVTNWTSDELNINPAFTRNEFKKAMTTKALLETECKLRALSWGYEFFISLDIDEYLVPKVTGQTIVDTLVMWHNYTGRGIYCIDKYNFQSSPHLLEPVNLLTIEAYQSRMKSAAKMNYYTSVSPKCAYRLTAPTYGMNTSAFIAECCHFHGCQGWDFRAGSDLCTYNQKVEIERLRGTTRKWLDSLLINHYARSLEKYSLKAKTWKTATGEAKQGESSEQAASGYDIPKFLARNVGWYPDNIALRYSCQLREQLKHMTGEDLYMRPGTQWYRNPEFGKEISDPDKRGRYGRPNAPGFKWSETNPYHYHGHQQDGFKVQMEVISKSIKAHT